MNATFKSSLLMLVCASSILHAASPSPASTQTPETASTSTEQADLDVVLDFTELDYLGPDTRLCNCSYTPIVGVRQPVWGNVAIALHEGTWHVAVLRQHFGFHDSGVSGAMDNVHTDWDLSSVLHCNISNPQTAASQANTTAQSVRMSRLSSQPSIWFHPSADSDAGSTSSSKQRAAHAQSKKFQCKPFYPSLDSYR